jgi:tRNA threonylcarbamoyladenosine biosynthesis protein TsaE
MPEIISNQKLSFNLNSLAQVAQTLIKEGKDEPIWLFYGDLGAGKTTLIKEVCIQLGVDAHVLSSPTFSIINEYPCNDRTLYHFDFYRMKNEFEILDLGIEEYFDSGNYCFIEWPERLGKIAPSQYFKVELTHTSVTGRTLEFEKHG